MSDRSSSASSKEDSSTGSRCLSSDPASTAVMFARADAKEASIKYTIGTQTNKQPTPEQSISLGMMTIKKRKVRTGQKKLDDQKKVAAAIAMTVMQLPQTDVTYDAKVKELEDAETLTNTLKTEYEIAKTEFRASYDPRSLRKRTRTPTERHYVNDSQKGKARLREKALRSFKISKVSGTKLSALNIRSKNFLNFLTNDSVSIPADMKEKYKALLKFPHIVRIQSYALGGKFHSSTKETVTKLALQCYAEYSAFFSGDYDKHVKIATTACTAVSTVEQLRVAQLIEQDQAVQAAVASAKEADARRRQDDRDRDRDRDRGDQRHRSEFTQQKRHEPASKAPGDRTLANGVMIPLEAPTPALQKEWDTAVCVQALMSDPTFNTSRTYHAGVPGTVLHPGQQTTNPDQQCTYCRHYGHGRDPAKGSDQPYSCLKLMRKLNTEKKLNASQIPSWATEDMLKPYERR